MYLCKGDGCVIHKEGKYAHWPCGIYDPKVRRAMFERRKKPCGNCGKLKSSDAKLCVRCNPKINPPVKKGSKLPLWWRKRISEGQTGEKHPLWKGDRGGYSTIHKWVYKNFIKSECCKFCNSSNGIRWANVSGNYTRERVDWINLCNRCHSKFDVGGRAKRFKVIGKTIAVR